jgi:hypothetical protein
VEVLLWRKTCRGRTASRRFNAIGYDGPISMEWEDAGIDRLVGAAEAVQFVHRLPCDTPAAAFDVAFGD